MKLLIDEGISESVGILLDRFGHETVHVRSIGLKGASDLEVLHSAASNGQVVLTLDADFHMILATTGAAKPSVIRLRIESARPETVAEMAGRALNAFQSELSSGAAVTVRGHRAVARLLPIVKKTGV